MTLAIPLSTEAEERLADKAKVAGVDLSTFVSRLLEVEAHRTTLSDLSGMHVLRPVEMLEIIRGGRDI